MTQARAEMPEHIRVAANQSGPVRREALMGREHVVVPAVLVRSQVLNNNLGPCFLPAEEITPHWAETANHSPVITDHPTQRGRPMSAREPGVINQMGVGQLYNVRVENGELKGDVYLDPARAEEVDGLSTILERVENGEPVELSTGFPLREAKPETGVHNGERYELVIRPGGFDHLAVFAEKVGACSVADGCGLGVNEDGRCDCGCGDDAHQAEEDEDMDEDEAQNVAQRIWAHMREMMNSEADDEAIHTQSSGEGDMNREELLEALNECEDVAFRRETLEAMNDEELAHVANEVGVTGEEEPSEPEPQDAKEEPADEAAENSDLVEAVNAIRETVESFGERLESLEEETEVARNQHAEERKRLVGDIAENSEFTEDELSDRPLAELRKIHKATATKARNFIGLGGPRKSDPADEEGELSFNVRSTWGAGPGEPVETKEN